MNFTNALADLIYWLSNCKLYRYIDREAFAIDMKSSEWTVDNRNSRIYYLSVGIPDAM